MFSGKSVIRRLFWLVIVLGATTGCLYNISNRIIYLAGGPTATTLSLERQDNLTFPAVTICNLNQFRRDAVNSIHPELGNVLRSVLYVDSLNASETFVCDLAIRYCVNNNADLANLSLDSISFIGRETYDDFIKICLFAGKKCNESHFIRFGTDVGYCFQFNSHYQEPLFEAVSTGTRAGLYVAINVNQSQYIGSSSFDAGVKVVVHTQSEPPRPEDTGVGVPPGTNAFIGVRQRNVIDNTQRDCVPRSDTSGFYFLSDEFDYTFASCHFDCLLRNIAEQCYCLYEPTNSTVYQHLPLCTLVDICCVVEQQRLTIDCRCLAACNTTDYQLFNSYSAFPAQYATPGFEEDLAIVNTSLQDNVLSVNVFFETLNIETQATNYAYGFVALLSDIGGQLGLFLGVSVISIMEFGTWIIDEVKNRLFGDETKLCCCCKQKQTIEGNETEQEDTYIEEENTTMTKNVKQESKQL